MALRVVAVLLFCCTINPTNAACTGTDEFDSSTGERCPQPSADVDAGQMALLAMGMLATAVEAGRSKGLEYTASIKDGSYTKDQAKDELVQKFCIHNAASGAVTVGGFQLAEVLSVGTALAITVPARLTAKLAISVYLQIGLVSAVAASRGLAVTDPQVRKNMLITILGDVGTVRVFGQKVTLRGLSLDLARLKLLHSSDQCHSFRVSIASYRYHRHLCRNIEGTEAIKGMTAEAAVQALSSVFVKTIVAQVGGQAVAGWASFVPLVGPAIAAATDYGFCQVFAQGLNWDLLEPLPYGEDDDADYTDFAP
jgi:hypothetical protein